MDDLQLKVGGRVIAGWNEIRVTRGIERMPSDFDVLMTERYPGETSGVVMQPGDPCQVLLGNDLVVTGYVDQYRPGLSASQHQIRVTGRGKCEDLVDCSAEWPSSQISGSTVRGIAERLAKPYGIKVSGLDGGGVPQFNVMYGETAWEIIERITRFAALLGIEQPDGNLLLTHVGTEEHASGFVQGKNIEQAEVELSMHQRYSEYWVYTMGANIFEDTGAAPLLIKKLTDDKVPRHRRKAIVADSGPVGTQDQFAIGRAVWEMNRRAARSRAIRLVCDSWRDAAGKLWQPNKLARIEAPALKLPRETWVIGEVTYRRGIEGTKAEVVLMPANAFLPEPIVLIPAFPDVPANLGRVGLQGNDGAVA